MKKVFWPISSRFIECNKPHEKLFKVPQVVVTSVVMLEDLFRNTYEVVENTKS